MEVLGAQLQVVTAACVVREREVVADRRDLLLPDPRVKRVARNLKAAKADEGVSGRDAVGGLRVIRPLAQRLLQPVQ